MTDELLTISQAALFLGVNPETLRRWDRSGRVVSLKVGARGDRRYKKTELEKIRGKARVRTDSQVKGGQGEDILYELLELALKEWGFQIVKLRPQKGGSQQGKDNISQWKGKLDGIKTLFEWSFEAKHYGDESKGREIPKDRIRSKLTQVSGSSVPRDCWCVFSPFGYVDNEFQELVEQFYQNKTYPFRIVLWTKYEQIEGLISCFPKLYKKVYGKESSIAPAKRQAILEKWREQVIDETRKGKLLHSKTNISIEEAKTLSPLIVKEMKQEFRKQGIEVALTANNSLSRKGSGGSEVVLVNEEIDGALALLNQGKIEESLTRFFLLLGKIEDKDGLSHEKARLYNNIGVAYNSKNDTDKAIEFFRKAVEKETNFSVALTNLASAHITKAISATNGEEKAKEFQKATSIIEPLWNSFNESSSPNVIQVYVRLLRERDGIENVLNFIKEQSELPTGKLFSSNSTLAFIAGSTYLEAHEPEIALGYAEKAHELDKDDPEFLFLRGRAYLSLAIKENAPTSATSWKEIVPIFPKKGNIHKAIQDIDTTMEMAIAKGMDIMFPQVYFLQKMSRVWAGEESRPTPPVNMRGMEDQKHFLEFIEAFKNKDYEHSFALLKGLEEFRNMPYEEKFRIARVYLHYGQPEIAKDLFDLIKEEAVHRNSFVFWLDYSVVATLLGEKNQAILAATKAKDVASKEQRQAALSHYGAVILRFADSKEGDRVLEGAMAFQNEFPELKILTAFNYEREKDKIIGIIKERKQRVENIQKLYRENPIPSYFLQETFKQPFVTVWAGRDPEMPLEYLISSEEFLTELETNYAKAKVFILDYLSLLTLSKLNLLSDIDKILPITQIPRSLFNKIQDELLRKEDENLRRVWNFLRKSKSINIVDRIKHTKFQGGRVEDIFEPWLIDTMLLAKRRGSIMVTDDLRFFRFLKSENISSVNSWLVLQKAKDKNLIDQTMYSRNVGKLAECFYVFIPFTGDDLFQIVFEDDFKLTARSYHLINQIFLPGSNLKSFAGVFSKFILSLWRPGMIPDDKIFWLGYLTEIFGELLDRAVKGTLSQDTVLSVGPDFGLMWRLALKNGAREEITILQSKFPEMMKHPLLGASKTRIKSIIDDRMKELNEKSDTKTE